VSVVFSLFFAVRFKKEIDNNFQSKPDEDCTLYIPNRHLSGYRHVKSNKVQAAEATVQDEDVRYAFKACVKQAIRLNL